MPTPVKVKTTPNSKRPNAKATFLHAGRPKFVGSNAKSADEEPSWRYSCSKSRLGAVLAGSFLGDDILYA